MNRRHFRIHSTALLGIFLVWPITAWVNDTPLWEAGVGVALISFPDYRGAKSRNEYFLPLPYLVHRGERLKVDRGGVRGILLEQPRFEIDVSIDGATPVRSGDDSPRSGMPDLDAVLEIGPSMNWVFLQNEAGRIQLRIPLRAAVSTDLRSMRHVGWKTHPQLHAETHERPNSWNLGFSTGPLFADRSYHDYYYTVAPEFSNPERPPYQAQGGYSGWSLLISASRRINNTWIGAYLRYDNLRNARFADSPLVETEHAAMAGLGISWIIDQSSRPAPRSW